MDGCHKTCWLARRGFICPWGERGSRFGAGLRGRIRVEIVGGIQRGVARCAWGGVCGGRGRAGKWFGGKLGGALRPGGAWRVGARGWPAGGWPPRVGQLGSCFAAQPAARLAGPSAQLSRQPARRASLPAQLEFLCGVQPPREPVGKGLPTKPNLHPARNFRH